MLHTIVYLGVHFVVHVKALEKESPFKWCDVMTMVVLGDVASGDRSTFVLHTQGLSAFGITTVSFKQPTLYGSAQRRCILHKAAFGLRLQRDELQCPTVYARSTM